MKLELNLIPKCIIRRSIQLAGLSTNDKYRLGAVVFKGSRIISEGYNKFRSCGIPSIYKKYPLTLHAEQDCINNVNWKKLKGKSILVVRINKHDELLLAHPCKYCMNTIKHIGIKNIYYSDNKGNIIREKVCKGLKN